MSPDSNQSNSEKPDEKDEKNTFSTFEGEDGKEKEVEAEVLSPETLAKEEQKEASSNEIGGNVKPSPESEFLEPDGAGESFLAEFWQILEQAGISKQRFFALILAFIALLFVAITFLFGGFNFNFGGSDVEQEEEVTEEEEEGLEEVDSQDVVESSNSQSASSSGVVAAYVIGLEYVPVQNPQIPPLGYFGSDSGVKSSFIIGDNKTRLEINFVYFIDYLNNLENLYSTDVYALLDKSVNRRKLLEEFLIEMRQAILDGEQIALQIDSQLSLLDTDYSVVVSDKDFYESSFFSSFDGLYGEESYEYLELFVEAGQVASEIRALYNAYNSLLTKYENVLEAIKPRYEDILENKEAIIEGIRIIDVENSDIDAIIRR